MSKSKSVVKKATPVVKYSEAALDLLHEVLPNCKGEYRIIDEHMSISEEDRMEDISNELSMSLMDIFTFHGEDEYAAEVVKEALTATTSWKRMKCGWMIRKVIGPMG